MVGLLMLLFLSGYIVVMLSLLAWSGKHPLMIGAAVLLSYMLGSLIVMMSVSFIVGIFLFLAGVSGMMVAFLYVVALCPNPVFTGEGVSLNFFLFYMSWFMTLFFLPLFLILISNVFSFSIEIGSMAEEYQWLREPCMYNGLATLMPILGALLFLCMVSVVCLCGQQKQCLGGQNTVSSLMQFVGVKRLYT
uniref:NADH dehydrogenase subunit 6 n=1 Tax=Latona dysoni TaxID=3246695 RepID=UPI00211391FA|nr:NADH dehydrogenase subunit 6 [Donax dysoni]UTM92206.1 NADH dehydrogenase subunit 6 [Donax dysoni]